MRRPVRILGFILAGVLAVGIGLTPAQDKPAGQDKEKKETVVADPLTGDWDGSVETQNGTISFGLKLKLEKDKVSGEIVSEQGGGPVNGTWTDGKFSVSFDYNGSPVAMSGALKDEVLSGDMSFGGGEMVMSWSAKKHAK